MRKTLLFGVLVTITLLLFLNCVRRQSRRDNNRETRSNISREQNSNRESRANSATSIVKMQNENGVYYVPCKINGTEMNFIFDTGASNITMSETEAIFLYKQGKLTEEDFVGTQQYQIADGSIQDGSIVVLRSVEIGNRTIKNVQASIIHNFKAPLLLGQSALSKFGKISIDYDKNEIAFE